MTDRSADKEKKTYGGQLPPAPPPPPAPPMHPVMFKNLLFFGVSLHGCDTNNITERQKKLITSSEWHSLKSTASKLFIFGHILGKFILNKQM